jgi:hypothetical protein
MNPNCEGVKIMNLEEIKRYDDSIWLRILKQRTVFDTDNIKAQKDWLIQRAEKAERYEKALKEIAKETGTPYADIAVVALNS